ncbi:hypothetical protein [Bacillus sp. FJAT-27445]|uniref:hypothetical protein n=1 Tax=Bacillus sp. FJAT-27445 TaxID=1679166 RepID=UPI00074365DC|nr:hypothetical protein [Bacillus sp. FJAT-27445]
MTQEKRPLSHVVIRNLMLETLGTEIFKQHGYRARQSNLFTEMEKLAIDKGLLEKKVNIPEYAWGADSHLLYSGHNTNFTPEEIQTLYAVFWTLLNQQVIAPGAYGESPNLPQFHVTRHGLECISANEVLPYDIDGYLSKVRSIPNLNEWVKTYMTEAVKCFNANCNHAATIMIGLAAEKLTLDLIDGFKDYLKNNQAKFNVKGTINLNGNTVDVAFEDEINGVWKISEQYRIFNDYYDGVSRHPQAIKEVMDMSSRKVFHEFARMTRNEVSHPNDLEKDNTETLLLFISFTKYAGILTTLTNSFKTTTL